MKRWKAFDLKGIYMVREYICFSMDHATALLIGTSILTEIRVIVGVDDIGILKQHATQCQQVNHLIAEAVIIE